MVPNKRQSDADAAENEIFPGRFERLMRAIDADHEHGRQRRELDTDPHEAEVVCDECQIHLEHQRLIHGVVEAQVGRRQAADLDFMGNVAGAECAGREADEGVEHDEDDVEIVDVQEQARLRSAPERATARRPGLGSSLGH